MISPFAQVRARSLGQDYFHGFAGYRGEQWRRMAIVGPLYDIITRVFVDLLNNACEIVMPVFISSVAHMSVQI